jgi:hypothetical protein
MGPMKLGAMAVVFLLATGCASRQPDVVKTQVITFPDGALIEFNGQPAGRAPARVVLPQNAEGRLTDRAVVRALPNSKQDQLYAQTRVFDPAEREDRVPNQIMIDMREPGPDHTPLPLENTTHVEQASQRAARSKILHTDRSKPTQAVGLDRWNPGKY